MKLSRAALAALLLALAAFAAAPARAADAANTTAPTELDIECSDVMPGCISCHEAAGASSRKLKGATADATSSLTTAVQTSFPDKPYVQPANFYCEVCNASAGYRLNAQYSRCECIEGFGSLSKNATCEPCDTVSVGTISRGGFLAICTDCGDLSWPNDYSNLCACISGSYGLTDPVTGQANCNACPDYAPVALDGSTKLSNCTACGANMEPSDDYSMCVVLGTGLSGINFQAEKALAHKEDTLDQLKASGAVPEGWEYIPGNMTVPDLGIGRNLSVIGGTALDLPTWSSTIQPGFGGVYNFTFRMIGDLLGLNTTAPAAASNASNATGGASSGAANAAAAGAAAAPAVGSLLSKAAALLSKGAPASASAAAAGTASGLSNPLASADPAMLLTDGLGLLPKLLSSGAAPSQGASAPPQGSSMLARFGKSLFQSSGASQALALLNQLRGLRLPNAVVTSTSTGAQQQAGGSASGSKAAASMAAASAPKLAPKPSPAAAAKPSPRASPAAAGRQQTASPAATAMPSTSPAAAAAKPSPQRAATAKPSSSPVASAKLPPAPAVNAVKPSQPSPATAASAAKASSKPPAGPVAAQPKPSASASANASPKPSPASSPAAKAAFAIPKPAPKITQ